MNAAVSAFQILLIEDDPADARLAQIALRDAKVVSTVHHVRDGVEALEFLRRKPPEFANAPRPDLVLLDLNMPRMDGRQVLQSIKSDPDLKTIPVVVLTTSDVDRDIAASYSLGANSFVTKPMDVDEFCAVIRGIESYWFSVVRLPRG